MTDFDFNNPTSSGNVHSDNAQPGYAVADGAEFGGTASGGTALGGTSGNTRMSAPQPEPESFNGPVAAAKPSSKLGGKVIAVIAGISLACGLVGGVGGAFAVRAIAGSGQPQMSQQGGPGQTGGSSQSGSGNGQMGQPPSGQPGQGNGGSDAQSGSDAQGQSGGQSGSGSGQSDSGQSDTQSNSGSNSSSSYSGSSDTGSIAS